MKPDDRPEPSPATLFGVALIFLTRLPVPQPAIWPEGALGLAAPAFPAVGLVVGALGAVAWAAAIWLGLSPSAAALVTLAATVAATGALHEDGLADTADGLAGGNSPARRLEIMRDSRLGSYGALALIFSVGLRWAALTALGARGFWPVLGALIAAHAGARACIAPLMWRLPLARAEGAAVGAGRPSLAGTALALALGGVAAVAGLGFGRALAGAAAAALAVGWLARAASRLIGGATGDLYGAAEQIAEIVLLLVASA